MTLFQKFCKHFESSSRSSNPCSPRRLQNHGNTCYLNATIQVLAQCQLITDWVRRNPTRDMDFDNPSAETLFGWRILRLIEDLLGENKILSGLRNRIKSMLSFSKGKRGRRMNGYEYLERKNESSKNSSRYGSSSHERGADATKEAILCLQRENVSPIIKGTGQQDSLEFIRLVYSSINAAFKSQAPRRFFRRRRTPFSTLVTGEGKTRTRCLRCGNITDAVQSFTEISVPIRIDVHLLDCLQEAFKPVRLQGENAYDCSHCGEKTDARQDIHVTELPPVLTVHLQRGGIDGQRAFKVMSRVHIPMSMTLRSSNPDNPGQVPQKYKYTLRGIVSHVGHQVTSGHYVSYVRTKIGEWFKCDDMTITAITKAEFSKEVLFPVTRSLETPYVLLYEGKLTF